MKRFMNLTTALIAAILLLFSHPLAAQSENNGYQLMKTYCYACHNPEVESMEKMLAPPMMMVKKHYLPNYPEKEAFIKAIMDWVKHPSPEKVLMPGAVRKFNIMPPLAYPDEVLYSIAEYMYENELEKPKMMGMHRGEHAKKGTQLEKASVSLNNGKKWDVNDNVVNTMNAVITKLKNFNGKEMEAYRQLGKEVFNSAKKVIMDKSTQGHAYDQLHNFFHGMENYIHRLMTVQSPEEGEKYRAMLEVYTQTFTDYFE